MIDLTKFTDPDDVRSYVAAPFVLDGYRHATNGHIIVRVPAPGEPDADLHSNTAATMRSLFAKSYSGFVPLPEVPAYTSCKVCSGKGSLQEGLCPDCDGYGEFTRGDHDYECKNCDGTGEAQAECRTCRGADEPFTLVQVGSAKFQAKYLRLIAELPNARISTKGPTDIAAILFDGGEGRLAPFREWTHQGADDDR